MSVHCAKNFLNLIFVVKIINVRSWRSPVVLQSWLQKHRSPPFLPAASIRSAEAAGAVFGRHYLIECTQQHVVRGLLFSLLYTCCGVKNTGAVICSRSCSSEVVKLAYEQKQLFLTPEPALSNSVLHGFPVVNGVQAHILTSGANSCGLGGECFLWYSATFHVKIKPRLDIMWLLYY